MNGVLARRLATLAPVRAALSFQSYWAVLTGPFDKAASLVGAVE
jgi:hypothetical protein